MPASAFSAIKALLAWSLLAVAAAIGAEIKDVTFWTPYAVGRPKTATFYYNGRAIGEGRDGFAAIVERIGTLPAGTSIVWGPNYSRCGACSGREPECVPKFLYPDLWKDLETQVAEHGLALSSLYPEPVPETVTLDERFAIPAPLSPDDPARSEDFDAVMDWHISEVADQLVKPAGHGGRFSSAGEALPVNDLDIFFRRLPENASVLIRVTLEAEPDPENEQEALSVLAHNMRITWQDEIAGWLHRGSLKVTLTAPPNLANALRAPPKEESATINWTNFHGPQTPHGEVLYLVNGRFVGHGDEGFARILATLDELPEGASVVLPRYEYTGQSAFSLSDEELARRNAELRDVVPFASRRDEFDAAIARRSLQLSFSSARQPTSGGGFALKQPITVMDWHSGDRDAHAFVSFGRIVRYDEEPSPAAARLGWTRHESGTRDENGTRPVRQLETEAVYTLNGIELGQGVPAFAQAMEKLAALPEGSVVQVAVCLRTKPPFTCPLIYEGQRHFERTGFEPYFGMFPWLIDVARTHQLQIEWLPDEERSCDDCELNR